MIETTLYVAINFYWLRTRVGKHERIVCDLQKLKQRKRPYKKFFYRSIALKIYYNFIKWNICCFTHGSTCLMRICSPVEYRTKHWFKVAIGFVDATAACIQQTLLIHIASSFISIRSFCLSRKIAITIVFIKVYRGSSQIFLHTIET